MYTFCLPAHDTYLTSKANTKTAIPTILVYILNSQTFAHSQFDHLYHNVSIFSYFPVFVYPIKIIFFHCIRKRDISFVVASCQFSDFPRLLIFEILPVLSVDSLHNYIQIHFFTVKFVYILKSQCVYSSSTYFLVFFLFPFVTNLHFALIFSL